MEKRQGRRQGSSRGGKIDTTEYKKILELIFEQRQSMLFAMKPRLSNRTATIKSYNLVAKALLDENDKVDIRVDDICRWYGLQYKMVYHIDCIDYNLFNARKTFTNLIKFYNLTNFELCKYICKWFITYHTLKYDIDYDKSLTLSSLKKDWIVKKLMNDEINSKQSFQI